MTLKDYLQKAQKEKWAIGQFNFSTLEQLRGILEAAKKLKSPVILGTSEGELSYLGLEETIALVEISKKRGAKLLGKELSSSFLNLDHGKDFDLIKKAIDYGFSAVHFDGSGFPLDKNIKCAKKVVAAAHRKGVLVEGEMEAIEERNLTSLNQVASFLEQTKVDSLAPAIGNKHGYWKDVKLDFERLKEIRQLTKKTDTFLVLHGGSGIPNNQIKKAIELGIVKINVNTELRMAWKRSLASLIGGREVRPYKILPKIQNEIQKKVEEKIKLFGSANKIHPVK